MQLPNAMMNRREFCTARDILQSPVASHSALVAGNPSGPDRLVSFAPSLTSRTKMLSRRIVSFTLGAVIFLPVSMRTGDVTFPGEYREWTHVKSAFVGPSHTSFATNGGFHHIYANRKAMEGYRSGAFPEGSVIVFDWIQSRDSAGRSDEGERRRVDVMEKNAAKFAAVGGWGFQRFAKNGVDRLNDPSPAQCSACHQRLSPKTMVIGRYRE
jgi:hypothetical protein